MASGSVRSSVMSRYRQWLTHKFGTWVDQFGMFGCVGCGRCIAWCPVGTDIRAELHYIGTPAHTTNDIVAYLPDQKVLFAGDLVFNGGTPFVLMGSVSGSLAAAERVRSFDADVVVPGHGPVCDLSVLDRARYAC